MCTTFAGITQRARQPHPDPEVEVTMENIAGLASAKEIAAIIHQDARERNNVAFQFRVLGALQVICTEVEFNAINNEIWALMPSCPV